MGVVNIRYSFDVDGLSGQDNPLHYDAGFNLVGALPYDFAGMGHHNPKRRPPQETIVLPWKDVRAVADSYPARETGFTWFENTDDSRRDRLRRTQGEELPLGRGLLDLGAAVHGEHAAAPARNITCAANGAPRRPRAASSITAASTGASTCSEPRRAGSRSAISAGWGRSARSACWTPTGTGSSTGGRSIWKDGTQPVRVTTVRDEKARRVPFDKDQLYKPYAAEVLPEAMAANEKLMKAMAEAVAVLTARGSEESHGRGVRRISGVMPRMWPGSFSTRTSGTIS